MSDNNFEHLSKQLRVAMLLIVLVLILIITLPFSSQISNALTADEVEKTKVENVVVQEKSDEPKVVDGKDVETGLVVEEGFEIVKVTCTRCHTAALVTQNRATREGWLDMIRWMQETQGLWQLGGNEKVILDYLEKNYSPDKIGRRKPLPKPEWYVLEE